MPRVSSDRMTLTSSARFACCVGGSGRAVSVAARTRRCSGAWKPPVGAGVEPSATRRLHLPSSPSSTSDAILRDTCDLLPAAPRRSKKEVSTRRKNLDWAGDLSRDSAEPPHGGSNRFQPSLTTTHGLQPTQHEVVWSLPPQGDSEGPLPSSSTQHRIHQDLLPIDLAFCVRGTRSRTPATQPRCGERVVRLPRFRRCCCRRARVGCVVGR
jgi:hypothetical protein